MSGARIDLQGASTEGTELVSVGRTDDGGCALIAASLLEPGEWVAIAAHPGYALARTPLETGVAEYVVQLRRGQEDLIAGRIIFEDGSSAGGGFRVVAWPQQEMFPVSDSAHGDQPADGSAEAVSDESGQFLIGGLDPAMRYRVTAGKPGYLAREPTLSCAVAPGWRSLVIRVDRLYGALVRLGHRGGGVLRTSPDLFGVPGPTWDVPDDLRGLVWLPDPAVALAGVSSPAAYRWAIGEHLFLCRGNGDEDRGRAVIFRVHVPGYASFEGAFDLLSVDTGLAEHLVELEPEASGWGDLLLAFNGREDRTWGAVHREKPLAKVVVEAESGERYSFAVHAYEPSGQALVGIPQGRYTLWLRNNDHCFHWPPEEGWMEYVQIGPEPFVHVIDCSMLGDIQIRAVASDGTPYLGRAAITYTPVRGEERGNEVATRFSRAPYVLEGLTPCSYELAFVEAVHET
ncbi:MAG: carboxypeptidase-like regulatory domain-containing protein [Candidatus Thermoplasmatota archaeon]